MLEATTMAEVPRLEPQTNAEADNASTGAAAGITSLGHSEGDCRGVPMNTMDGWTFTYDDSTRFVGADHANGIGKFSVCEVVTPPTRDAFRVKVGKAIADALNGSRWDVGKVPHE